MARRMHATGERVKTIADTLGASVATVLPGGRAGLAFMVGAIQRAAGLRAIFWFRDDS